MNGIVHIPRRSLIKELRLAVPDFVIDPESADLEYVIICDFARYICERAKTNDFKSVEQAIDFMEEFVSRGDSNSHGLIAEGLDSLRACDCFEGISKYFKTRVSAIWKSIVDQGS